MKIEINKIKIGKRIRKDLGDLTSLKESIQKIGLINPITVDNEYNLLAGVRRIFSCKQLGYTSIDVILKKSNNQIEIDENVQRKDFTPSESVSIWLNIPSNQGKQLPTKLVGSEPKKKASEITGISTGGLSKAKQVIEYGDEEIIKEMNETGNISNSFNEVKKLKRKIEIDVIRNSEITTPTGKFDVIMMDVPWPYPESYDPQVRRMSSPYPQMSIEDIKNIEIPSSENCVLFFWTTQQFIPDTFEIIKHYGFEYKTVIVWDKVAMGMGNRFRIQCEFCIFAIKGKPLFCSNSERDIIRESKREHSRKPESIYEMIDRICVGRKLDMFSRRLREGWINYGNETTKFN